MEHLSQESKREQEELRRINTIESLAEKYELRDSGMRAIASGISVQEFNENSMKEIDARNERARSMRSRSESGGSAYNETRHTPNHYMGMPCDNTTYGRAMENYSLLRVLRGISDPRALSDAGLELEISNDMQRVLGKRSKGVMVPFEALQHRAVTAGGTGSNLIATDHLAGSFIDVLRNRSLVMSLGPTVLRGLVGDVEIPRKTSGAGAYWIAGDDSDSITESNIALDQVTLAPKTVGGAVRFSHRMIIQSSPDVEAMVRQDLADMVASEIDLKSISGSGSSNQPLGILGQAGVGSTTYANGGAPDFDDIVDLETAIAIANADSRLAYLTTPTLAGALKKTPKQGSGVEGNFVWHNGKMNDLSAYKSNNMTDGFILLGDWSQLLIGFWGGIELDADPYGTNFLKGSVTVRVLADVDIGVRHPEAFAEIHEAAA